MYNSEDEGEVFQVHTNEGIVEFKPFAWGLHYHDVSDASSNIELMLVNTVRENFKGYTHNEVKKAREAQHIQGLIVNPTKQEFVGMVCEQLLTNRPVAMRDVDNANQIVGPDLIWVKYVQIPRDFVQLHKYVALVADVMFVNGLPFLVTSMQGLSVVTIEHLLLRTAKRLAQSLERVFRIYGTTRFVVQMAVMVMEFEKLKNLMPQ